MAHDIFISYSSHDKAIADAVCATLEAQRIRCWIAPRDIMPGTLYGEALVDAIDGSRLLVLVFSSAANNSPQVMREVERAVSRVIAILPFRIENVLPSKAMQFFLPSIHWLDALTPRLEEHLHALADTARVLLDRIDRDLASAKTKNSVPPFEQAAPAQRMSAPPSREAGAQTELKPIRDAPPTWTLSHDSRYYVERPVDREMQAAIAKHDSVIRIRGAHQVGKTSLLARGLEQARASGSRVAMTDFQRLSAADLESVDALFRTLGEWIADELKLDIDFDFDKFWNRRRNPALKFNQFICQEVLERINEPLVWAMDETDCLFPCPFRSEVFGLFRSWHNARATEPTKPWRRLTVVLAYATEAHLLFDNLEQSPFNVGTSLVLDDFSREQVAELNRRYDSPLRTEAELESYWNLVGGHPHLVNRGFHEMVETGLDLAGFKIQTERNGGIFNDHLHLLLTWLSEDSELWEVVRGVLCDQPKASIKNFLRLRSAGVLAGESIDEMHMRCQLYATYLKKHMP